MLYYSVLHNNYRYKYILLFLNYYGGDNHSEFNPYIKGFRNNHLPLCFSCCLYHFEQRIPTGQSKMDNPRNWQHRVHTKKKNKAKTQDNTCWTPLNMGISVYH